LVLVHVIWAVYQRRCVLPESLDGQLVTMLGSNARKLKCDLVAMGCAGDHVHIVVRLAATTSLARLAQQLKGASAHELNSRHVLHEHFAWQEGYWAESVSPADYTPLVEYLRDQRIHHDASHPAERWQAAQDEVAHSDR
jgi:REP element-mobilizing transposase RayT